MDLSSDLELPSDTWPATEARSDGSEGAVPTEFGRMLEDVRTALNRDLGTATAATAARRLAEALASKAGREPARGGLAPWQERNLRNYIEDRLERPLRVAELAARVSLSASHFSRAFAVTFGEPPHSFIVGRRIARARTLMLKTAESLSQIALACGFVDQTHLCRCFRRSVGMPPGVWRRSRADMSVPPRTPVAAVSGLRAEPAHVVA